MGLREDAAESRMKKKVEEALRSKMKAQALKECDSMVAKFAECAKGRTLSVVWSCRAEARVLNDCLHQYTNDEVLEKFKKQYEEESLLRS
ncbi:hypothetical protein CY35_15G091700 [Sphagnum magellanicum]|nr:hypothetical protein CY35_15G091700 [Sphagnum magellanicum]